MIRTNLLAEDYYNWLLDLIEDDVHDLNSYSSLLNRLFTREFYSLVANDDNRVFDGLELRNKFAETIPDHLYFVLDGLPDYCTVLEMLIALSIRIEDNILYDPDEGYRASEWFWLMISNIGLDFMTDDEYSEEATDEILDIFLERRYQKDGRGSIFYVLNSKINMKKEEIWYQANYFFSEYLGQND